MSESFILTLSCHDRIGIVHAVTGLLVEHGGNISEAAQFNDRSTGHFFMRVQFSCPESSSGNLKQQFADLGSSMQWKWTLHAAERRMRTVVLVSKLGHCLNDLLYRHRSGLLPIDICAVVSNHSDLLQQTASYGIPFFHIPVTAVTKNHAETRLLEIVHDEGVELVVLARYMQILSDELCCALEGKAINIHHSFLPSFKGARPYQQAHDRGVKIIGATAHYVTGKLDEGKRPAIPS
jgi:formyltetrahydrofolate deformylase